MMADNRAASVTEEDEFKSTDDIGDGGRRARVQALVRSIGTARKNKQKSMMTFEMPHKISRGSGRYPELKIQIGWLHYHRGKFRQVPTRKGGGTRTYQYSRDVEQTVDMLKICYVLSKS